MTYAAAITDLKTQMTDAKAALSASLTDLASVENADPKVAAEITNLMRDVSGLMPTVLRLEALPVPSTAS